jgi:hypothetical protein
MIRSFIFITLGAVLLGLMVAFGTLLFRWIPLAQTLQPRTPPPVLVSRDWDFWTLEIGSLSEDLLKERKALSERDKELSI